LGPDGSLYIATDAHIRRVGPDGIITTFAGDGVRGYSGDGGPASAARIWMVEVEGASIMTVLPDGSVVFADWGNNRIRRIDPSGIINTIAGNGETAPFRYGELATATSLGTPPIVAASPDGTLNFVADDREPTVARIAPPLQPKRLDASDELTIADGGVLQVFNAQGRHLRTVNADTGAVLAAFSYDTAGLLQSMVDVDNNVTRIERRTIGNSISIVAPGGQETTLSLSSAAQVTSIATAPDETTTFTYTAAGLMKTMTDPKRNTTQFSWNALGLLESDRDAEGGEQTLTRNETTNGYDIALATFGGRTKKYETRNLVTADITRKVIDAAGAPSFAMFGRAGTTQATFSDGTSVTNRQSADPAWGLPSPFTSATTVTWPSGRTLAMTATRTATFSSAADPRTLQTRTDTLVVNGKTTTRTFDRAALMETVTTPMGRTLRAILDPAGRTRRMEVPGVLPIDMSYDARGRLASMSQGTRGQAFGYNDKNELTSVTDALGRFVTFQYDAAGRLAKQILPDLREIGFAYDANGNLTSVSPPSRAEHTFEYNRVNLATDYVSPAVAGTDRTEYIYNVDRELEQIVRPDGSTIDLGYDSGGRLQSLVAASVARSFAYDAAGNLSLIAGGSASVSYQYDGSTLTQVTWSGSVSGNIDWTYDADSRLASESAVGDVATFTYDDDGLLMTAGALQLVRRPEGIIDYALLAGTYERFVRDGHGDLDELHQETPSRSFLAFDYSRDRLGRITGIMETREGADLAIGYHYDISGRLDEVTYPNVLVRYKYDSNGNRTAKELIGATSTVAETASYDNQDRLLNYDGTAYTYTPNGELFTTNNTTGTTRYNYDPLGNLLSVTLPDGTLIEYLIDAQNRRVGRKVNGAVTHHWLYADQLRIIAELDAAGVAKKRFVYGTRTNVPDYMVADGVTYRIYADHLGSPRMVVNVATGVIAQMRMYDEFGIVLTDTNPGFIPFGFAGGLYDSATQLVRFGARDYDAGTGRWTTKDPIGFHGGAANLYEYVNSSPVNTIDPLGLSGKLTIYSSYGGGSSGPAMFDSHSWIVYTPDNGAPTSYGTFGFGTPAPRGLNTNWELDHWNEYANRTKYTVFSRTTWLDDAQEAALMATIDAYRRQGDDAWTSGKTCSTFAGDAWRAGTGENLVSKTKKDRWPNPVTLSRSILQANDGLTARVNWREK